MTGDLIERLKHRADTMNGAAPVGASDGCGTYTVGYYGMVDRNLDREVIAEIASLRTSLATEREARKRAEAAHAAARQNFHTMQLAADALRKRAEAAEVSLAEAKRLLKRCETQIVALYSSAAPMGNYENELTINGHVSGNNFADRDEVVKDARRFLSQEAER